MPQDQYADEVEQVSSLLSLARQTYEAHIQEAKDKASEIMLAAEKQVEETLGNSRKELEFLKKQIVLHRDFEIRYRESLKGYLGGLLNEINDVDEFVLEEHQDTPSISAFASVDDDEEIIHQAPTIKTEDVVEETLPIAEPEPISEPEPIVEEALKEEIIEAASEDEEAVEEEEEEEETLFEIAPKEVKRDIVEELLEQATANIEAEKAREDMTDIPLFEIEDEDDPSDDLPAVPERIESFGTETEEIEILDSEIEENDEDMKPGRMFDVEETDFDTLVSTSSNDSEDSFEEIIRASDLIEDPVSDNSEDVEKKLKGFFGFKKN